MKRSFAVLLVFQVLLCLFTLSVVDGFLNYGKRVDLERRVHTIRAGRVLVWYLCVCLQHMCKVMTRNVNVRFTLCWSE